MRIRGLSGMRRSKGALWAGVAIVLAALLAIWWIFWLVGNQRDFELQRWKDRLSASASGISGAAGEWMAERQRALRSAASNPSVQIYMSELALAGGDGSLVAEGEAKRAIVGSYVASLGLRAPFGPAGASPANQSARSGGVALFAADGSLVASSPGYSPSFEAIKARLAEVKAAGGALPVFGDGGAAMAFVAPVPAMQAQSPDATPVGYFVAASPLGEEFFRVLEARSGFDVGVTLLDRRAEGTFRLDGRNGGEAARLLRQDAKGDAGLLEAAGAPGTLQAGPGPDGRMALLVASPVAGSSLVAVSHVDGELALGGVTERLRTLLVSLLFCLLAVIAGVFALWRHGVSVNAVEAAVVARAHAAALQRRERMLQMVADTYPGGLVLADRDKRIVFANARFAGEAGAEPALLAGRPLGAALPAEMADAALRAAEQSDRQGRIVNVGEIRDAGGRALSVTAAPFRGGDEKGGALLSIDDITDAVEQREKKARFYWALTDLLLDAIDQRDPGAAAHSRRVAALAADLARASGAGPEEIETAEIAGALLNVGKLFVSDELLTKAGALAPDERLKFSTGGRKWLNLLAQVPFDLPIGAVLSEAHELMNGMRTLDDPERPVRREARIIVVANGFVALVSPRTYRTQNSPAAAVAELTSSVLMDRETVEALRELVAAGRDSGAAPLTMRNF